MTRPQGVGQSEAKESGTSEDEAEIERQPKAAAKQDVDDDSNTFASADSDERASRSQLQPLIGARAGSSSAGPNATTTSGFQGRAAPGHRDPAQQRRRAV
jgi:hypothetical protein